MSRRSLTLATLMLLLVAALVHLHHRRSASPDTPPIEPRPAGTIRSETGGEREILDAFAERRSGLMVESVGVVQRMLPDDQEGSRHQKFILRLESGHTLLVSHNIDLAPRIPIAVGDPVEFRGQYEWNPRGGVIHWTHRDPDGRRAGGWVSHDGQRYD